MLTTVTDAEPEGGSLNADVEQLLHQLSDDEKVALLSGLSHVTFGSNVELSLEMSR